MLKKVSPDQLKFGLLIALLIYLVNGQTPNTSVTTQNSNARPSFALAASTPAASSPMNGCTTAQRQVQLPADAVLNLRSYANGPVISTLAPGTTVTAQRRDGAWLKVTTSSGQSGWAFSQYLGCR